MVNKPGEILFLKMICWSQSLLIYSIVREQLVKFYYKRLQERETAPAAK